MLVTPVYLLTERPEWTPLDRAYYDALMERFLANHMRACYLQVGTIYVNVKRSPRTSLTGPFIV
jgi:hypothetical protein